MRTFIVALAVISLGLSGCKQQDESNDETKVESPDTQTPDEGTTSDTVPAGD